MNQSLSLYPRLLLFWLVVMMPERYKCWGEDVWLGGRDIIRWGKTGTNSLNLVSMTNGRENVTRVYKSQLELVLLSTKLCLGQCKDIV